MGSYQSTVNILAQDLEFDDIFVKYLLKDIKFIYYLIGSRYKIDNEMKIKRKIMNDLDLHHKDIPILYTNNKGISDNIEEFYNIVKKDLQNIHKTPGITLQLLITGQCAPLINIINNLINNEIINPSTINIYIINNKYNGQMMFKELLDINKTSDEFNITLNIHNFSAYNSTGIGCNKWGCEKQISQLCTSEKFSNKILELHNNKAKHIIKYAININANLKEITIKKINECISIFKQNYRFKKYINSMIKVLNNYIFNIENIYNKMQKSNNMIDKKLCNDLYEQYINISNIIYYVTRITYDRILYNKLKNIYNWFIRKCDVIKSCFIKFSLHDIALYLMFKGDSSLTSFIAYGINNNNYLDIVKNKPSTEYIKVLHYVSNNPITTCENIENTIINIIAL